MLERGRRPWNPRARNEREEGLETRRVRVRESSERKVRCRLKGGKESGKSCVQRGEKGLHFQNISLGKGENPVFHLKYFGGIILFLV